MLLADETIPASRVGGGKASQTAQMEHPLDDECEMFTVQYVELLSIFSSSFCLRPTGTAHPPTFIFAPPFPSIQPFSSRHPWSGGPSLWEVKGHLG